MNKEQFLKIVEKMIAKESSTISLDKTSLIVGYLRCLHDSGIISIDEYIHYHDKAFGIE